MPRMFLKSWNGRGRRRKRWDREVGSLITLYTLCTTHAQQLCVPSCDFPRALSLCQHTAPDSAYALSGTDMGRSIDKVRRASASSQTMSRAGNTSLR